MTAVWEGKTRVRVRYHRARVWSDVERTFESRAAAKVWAGQQWLNADSVVGIRVEPEEGE